MQTDSPTLGAHVATDERAAFEVARQGGAFENPPALCPAWLATNLREEGWLARASLAGAPDEPPKPIDFAGFIAEAKRLGCKIPADMAEQLAAAPDLAATGTGDTERDAARFAAAIALEDNAEALYAAVMNHAPDAEAIRLEFDAAMQALAPTQPTGAIE